MKKADKNKLLYLVSISLILLIAGCVDTNVTNIPTTIDYRAKVNVVNLVAGANSASITMDIASGGSTNIGTLNIGSAWPSDNSYQDIPSGSKVFNIEYSNGKSDQLKISTETDKTMRLFIIGDVATGTRTILKAVQGYTFDTSNAVPSGMAQVSFFTGSPDDTLSTDAAYESAGMISGKDTTFVAYPGNLTSSSYTQVKAGSYTFFVTNSSGKVFTKTVSLDSRGSYTVVNYGYVSDLKLNVLTDD